MTSEVAVMNRYAVALAADSAVTVRVGDGSKIFNSANKLFALSKRHPVAVMFFNNASLLGVPWETIIKMCRAKLGKSELSTVVDYGRELINFLDGNTNLFPLEAQDEYYLRSIYGIFRVISEEAQKKYFEIIVDTSHVGGVDRNIVLKQVIMRWHENWAKKGDVDCFPEDFGDQIRSRYHDQVLAVALRAFDGYQLDDETKDTLISLSILLVIKDDFMDNYSGLVVAGFGKDEHFPSLKGFQIGEVILNKLKYKATHSATANNEYPAVVQPFAQDEMVEAFLQGMNPRFRWTLFRGIINIAFDLPEAAIDAISDLDDAQKDHWKLAIKPHSREAIDKFVKDMEEYRQTNHWDPIHQAINFLPKDELAQVAETLVSLNSFQKRMSMDAETVGGPIDVAVISKGDGLVWIKRKHYFSQELNPQFVRNYNEQGEP